MKRTTLCPLCNKQLKLIHEHLLSDGTKLNEYSCGHLFSRVGVSEATDIDFESADGSGKKARPYQEDGVEFIIQTDFNVIIADQMRLGKTPQALLALKNRLSERTPALVLVKSANLWQWIREFRTWTSTLPNGVFPITGTQAAGWIPPGFSAYIVSMDTFSRPRVLDQLKKIPFKLIIADEAHSFKNTSSNRSQALVEFVSFLNNKEIEKELNFACVRCQTAFTERGKLKYDKRIGHTVISKSTRCPKCSQYCYMQQQHDSREKWIENPEVREKIEKLLLLASPSSNPNAPERALAKEKAEALKKQYNVQTYDEKPVGLVLLTGTPILNRADEYFVPLNLIQPERFHSLEAFRREWLVQDEKGRWNRVKSHKIEEFKNLLKGFMLRREKEDVFTDIPPINEMFTFIESSKDLYTTQYNRILDKIDIKLADKANPTYFDMADEIMELRRICGMMKIPWVVDYLETCTLEGTSRKYAIGIHHKSVRDLLYASLGGDLNCLKLSGEESSEAKDRIMREWEHDTKRQFLIINQLAGGVGMDFHYCDDVLNIERQWNLEMERQFIFRFYNPDKSIKRNPLNVETVLIKGSFEEWWYNMLEEKRRNVDPLVYNNYSMENEQGTSFRDLMEMTTSARL